MAPQRLVFKKEYVILLITFLSFLIVLYCYSLKFDKNITGFMVIGDYFKAPQIWTSQTYIRHGSVGYDGQFYFYMAHDPFIKGHSFDHIDFPAYRYQRIIYPLTVWLLSFGQGGVIPYMMVAVNLLGILLGTYFILLLLKEYRRNPWIGLCYVTTWGFLLCLLRSLPEPMAVTFVVVSVWASKKKKLVWQGIGLSLAALTQETTLLVALSFFLYSLKKKDYRQCLYLALPFGVYLGWQGYIYFHFKTFSFLGGTQNFGLPLWGILEKFLSLGQGGLSLEKGNEMVFLLLVLWLIAVAFFEIVKTVNPLTIAFFGYALMTVFFNKLIWVEPWSYARATMGLLVFNFLIFTIKGRRINLFSLFVYPITFLMSLWSMILF